jgi:hypothetical protein
VPVVQVFAPVAQKLVEIVGIQIGIPSGFVVDCYMPETQMQTIAFVVAVCKFKLHLPNQLKFYH